MSEEIQADVQAIVSARLALAGESWERGDLTHARAELEAALMAAREQPARVKFRSRVQLATMLAGVCLAQHEVDAARALLQQESVYAEKIFQFIQAAGTLAQKRAATGDFVQLRELLTKVSLIGQAAPEISVQHWINSAPLNLMSLRGRVVLLEFWATWCKQCEEVFPRLSSLNHEYGARGLSVIALTRHYMAYDGGREAQAQEIELIQSFVRKYKLEFPVGVSADEQTQELYGASGLPSFVLIDRQGIVRYAYGSDEDESFKKLLTECLEDSAGSQIVAL